MTRPEIESWSPGPLKISVLNEFELICLNTSTGNVPKQIFSIIVI